MTLALALAMALASANASANATAKAKANTNLKNQKMRNFRDYDIWKGAIELSKSIYCLTQSFPASERYGLTDQIRRAVVSMGSNIAEGSSRKSEKDFCRYLEISLGSSFEVETQLIIAHEVEFVSRDVIDPIIENLHVFQRQTHNLINILDSKK